jgi:hypothetical protein
MKDKKHEDRKALKQAGAARKKDALACSQRALAAHVKPRKVGKPFKKGEDPRRHKLGRVSLDRAAFAAQLNNYFCNGIGEPKALAEVLWKCALKGQAWAVCELLDRICGKVMQSVQVEEPRREFIIRHADDFRTSNEEAAAVALSPTDEKAKRALELAQKAGC